MNEAPTIYFLLLLKIMAGFSIIEHKGKKINYLNLSGSKEPEMLEILKANVDYVLKQGKPYCSLINLTNSFATPAVMKYVNQSAPSTKPYLEKGAIIGVTGIKKHLLRSYNLFLGKKALKPFETEEEAKEYLIS